MNEDQPITSEIVPKLEAARRQLKTAIELWFADKDKVSILTLSYAAYEVIHTISAKRGRTHPLIFDTPSVPLHFRKLLSFHVKKVPNFFKHADRDSEGSVELKPAMAEGFLTFSILELQTMGISPNRYESAFMWWFNLTRPHWLTPLGRELIEKVFPIEEINEIRSWPKNKFLKAFLNADAL
jgi:hypothetical protein